MNILFKTAVATALSLAALTACNDDTTTIGSSLIQDQVAIVVDSSFTVTGHAVASGSVQSRTILQLLGSVNARDYGSLRSDVVTQFMPAQNLTTEDVTVDSVRLIMRMPLGGFVGDSLVPMGLDIYRLTAQLPQPIYSDFNPEGYYDPSSLMASGMYTATRQDENPSPKSRYIRVDLGRAFGEELLARYKSSPETFANPTQFARWFPGLYIRSSFGSGRIVQVDSTIVKMYYSRAGKVPDTDRDTVYHYQASYLSVTPEVLTNNNMSLNVAPSLKAMADAGSPILVAPIGYDVRLRFPAREIIEAYNNRASRLAVINQLTFKLPVAEIANSYSLTPPPYVLLVKTSEKDEFFSRSKLPDNKTSFYATYDNFNHCYNFSSMRDYILALAEKGEVTDDDMDFTICPVTVGFERNSSSSNYSYYYYYYYTPETTTLTVASVTPYVNKPSMGLLELDKAKIVFTYSVQNTNF